MIATVISPAIQTASIGIPDTMFLMVLALIVFGPRRLPEIGRQIGKLMYEFRKVSNDFKFQMEEELRASEEAARQQKLAAAAALPKPPVQVVLPPTETTAGLDFVEPSVTPTTPINEAANTTALPEPVAYAPALAGEVRGEPRKFPHITPPVSGEPIAAARPFRTAPEPAAPISTESALPTGTSPAPGASLSTDTGSAAPALQHSTQPGIASGNQPDLAEQEARHA